MANLFTLAADTHKFESRYLDSMIGPLPEAAEVYRDRSPIYAADQLRDPIAIFQGTDDQVVPPAQAEEIVASLRRRNIPHVYHLYEGEGHGWRKPETVRAFYQACESFLRQHVLFAWKLAHKEHPLRYETVIGMEVHVELQTASKMFCACAADHFQVAANDHICPVCTGQPGALPVINGRAVELTVMTGMALNCQIKPSSVFARKNYVYPDLPKGYQISQYEQPLCESGWIEIDGESGPKQIGVVRVHLEEDTGKLQHAGSSSLIDYNRAGVPLMEIVTDSSLRSADESYAYLTKIRADRPLPRRVLRRHGERGHALRGQHLDPAGGPAANWAPRSKSKNLNSFRAVRSAIAYEAERQQQIIEAGGHVQQETMGWDERANVTRPQRSKETSDDYRYFPEPDLLVAELDDEWINSVHASLPELPAAKAARFADSYGLNPQETAALVEDHAVAAYFEEAAQIQDADPKQVGNWITGEVFRRLNAEGRSIEDIEVRASRARRVALLSQKGHDQPKRGPRSLWPTVETRRLARRDGRRPRPRANLR